MAKSKPNPLYDVWKHFRNSNTSFRWQGAEGFRNFLADMEPRPPKHRLYRLDKSKPYGPDNCYWFSPIVAGDSTKKRCSDCRDAKPLSAFSKGNAKAVYGLYHRCKECASNFDKTRKTSEMTRASNWKNHYGLVQSDILFLMALQNSKCAICEQPFSGFPDVDHSHSQHTHARKGQWGCKECVRGLLCGHCNMALGLLELVPKLQNAVAKEYLSRRPFLNPTKFMNLGSIELGEPNSIVEVRIN